MSGDEAQVEPGGDPHEVDELLGAFALDALDVDERRRVEDYLRINPRAAAEVQSHREVATMLAFTGMDAPDDLWTRIATEIEAEPPAPGPELARILSIDPPTSDAVASRPGRGRRGVVGRLAGAAAVVALSVVGAIAVTGLADTSSNDPIAEAFSRARDDRDSVEARLVTDGSSAVAIGVIDEDGHGYLDASGLPRLASDQTYQLWGVLAADGEVVSLGILGPTPELETFTAEGDVATLAVTVERSPGVVSDGNPDGAFVGELS